jgi:hypothetical protein
MYGDCPVFPEVRRHDDRGNLDGIARRVCDGNLRLTEQRRQGQLSPGVLALSTTITSSGPLAASSLTPSCSFSAVNIDGPL